MARWGDVQKVGIVALTTATGKRAASKTPSDLQAVIAADGGFFRVRRGPGADDGVTDEPLLDVEAFAGTEQAAWNLAEDARQAIHALGGQVIDGVLIDSVSTATGPVSVDWGNPAIERFVASYRLALRQQFTE